MIFKGKKIKSSEVISFPAHSFDNALVSWATPPLIPHTQGLLICQEICPEKDSTEAILIRVAHAISAAWHLLTLKSSKVAIAVVTPTAGEYAVTVDLRDLSTNLSMMRESTALVTLDRV